MIKKYVGMFIVKKTIRKFVRHLGHSISPLAIDKINEINEDLIQRAREQAQQQGRKTIRVEDFEAAVDAQFMELRSVQTKDQKVVSEDLSYG